ncbi:MAG: restriction endonuclease subunit S [Candidatus Blackburnbacteria bacterium]|nr:restriction endonuclease subunit S [Candidatus Blackburnbacteria bacterium]
MSNKKQTSYKPANAKATAGRQTEIGEIPEDWEANTISNLGIKIIDGDRSSNYPHQGEFLPDGYCLFLSTKNVPGNKFDFTEKSFITKEKDNLLRKGKLQRGDIVLTTRGTVGNIAIYSDDVPFENIRINSGMVVLRNENRNFDLDFLYQLLRSGVLRRQYISFSSGSAQPQLPIKDLKNILLLKPTITEQQQIASVLCSLDYKIELNRKMNKTLEEMGKALFKRWFVDFEFPNEKGKPYKSSDGEMVNSGLGKIPKGWEVETLDSISEIKNGFAFKSEDYTNKGVFLLRTRNFSQSGYVVKDEVACLPSDFYEKFKNYQLQRFDVLLVMVGASVGNMGFVTSHVLPALQNQNMWNFRARDSKNQIFVKFLVERVVKENVGSASGSARDFFRKDFFRTIRFVNPDKSILSKFDIIIRPLFEQVDKNLRENDALSQLRDSLLPRLMSGKLRVN